MTNLTNELIEKIVKEQISGNMERILNSLTCGADEQMSYERLYTKMIINSIEISTRLSVKIIMDLLYRSGLVAELDTKALLKQLSSFQED